MSGGYFKRISGCSESWERPEKAGEEKQTEEEIMWQPEGGKMNYLGQCGKESPCWSGVSLGTLS